MKQEQRVLNAVCAAYGVTPDDIFNKYQRGCVVARQAFVFFLWSYSKMSYHEIGILLRRRASSIHRSISLYSSKILFNPSTSEMYEGIKERLA